MSLLDITNIKAMKLSLVNNFNSIQSKIDNLVANDVLDIKQISDLERFVGMQNIILDSLDTLEGVVKGEF